MSFVGIFVYNFIGCQWWAAYGTSCRKKKYVTKDDGFYDVYTFNQSLQKRLRSFAEKYPDDCWLKGSSEDGSETYMIKKGRLSLNLRPPYSKDRIHKATERIIEEQKEQSKDS